MNEKLNFNKDWLIVAQTPSGESLTLVCTKKHHLILRLGRRSIASTTHPISRPDIANEIIHKFIALQIDNE